MSDKNTPTISVKEYISSLLDQIESSLPDGAVISGDVKLEMSVISQTGKDGSLDFRVVNYGSGISQKEIQKVTWNIRFPTERERLEDEAAKIIEQKKIDVLRKRTQPPVEGVKRADSEPGYFPGF